VAKKFSVKQIRSVIKTLYLSGRLKKIKRTGWIVKGIKDVESVADHTWRMSLLILILTPNNLDKQKLLSMCIVHDLGEITIGDLRLESGKKVLGNVNQKQKKEINAVRTLFSGVDNANKYISLLKEFFDQKTPEAKFLKQLDKLEMILQALEYEQEGYPQSLLDEFWENAEKYLVGKDLEPIFRELVKMRGKIINF